MSGGLDSSTTLAVAAADGFFETYALSFRYGQRHSVELDSAVQGPPTSLGAARHVVLDIDLRVFGASALTADIDVPKARSIETMGEDIPITYVPVCGNTTSCRSRRRLG